VHQAIDRHGIIVYTHRVVTVFGVEVEVDVDVVSALIVEVTVCQ
jgi:hypothetical protein